MDWVKYFIIEKYNLGVKINNLKQGYQLGYYNNYNYHMDGDYYIDEMQDGKFNGICCNWYYNKNIRNINYCYEEDNSCGTKRHGNSYIWSIDGRLCGLESHYLNNLHGIQIEWNHKGNLSSIENYRYGIRHGIQIYWYHTNQLCSIHNYKHGELHQIKYTWDIYGNIGNIN